MKKVNINWLLLFTVAVWALVFFLSALLVSRVYASVPRNPVTIVPEPSFVEQPEEIYEVPKSTKEAINPILEKSIELCKLESSERIANAVMNASKKHGIPVYVIYALIATESCKYGTNDININNILNVNDEAVSRADCVGLTQVSPRSALVEYNKEYDTNYTKMDLYDIDVNIEIGVWYYKQFMSVSSNWTEMYVIYNVGYGRYNKINSHWFFGWDGKWYSDYRNKFFFMNDMYPPSDDTHGLYGKNKLKKYNPKRRFEVCLKLCKEHFDA